MRRVIAFDCGQDTLVGTLDEAMGAIGLLIVSGGNEVRAGAHRGMAELAAALADAGVPVFRYDRRGIGDATGVNTGWAGAADDLVAAAAAFRVAAPHVTLLAGFGNCDGATSLALHGAAAGIERLILANPWVVTPVDDLPPAPALRARYSRRLRDPGAWRRLLTGRVPFGRLLRGLLRASGAAPSDDTLADRVFAALRGRDVSVILARNDATAQAYAAAAAADTLPTQLIDTASHSFARPPDAARLAQLVLEALASPAAGDRAARAADDAGIDRPPPSPTG